MRLAFFTAYINGDGLRYTPSPSFLRWGTGIVETDLTRFSKMRGAGGSWIY
jgi:hypothetical protein